jgi:pimeloyl-ACP methyl ester carboxylesterase
VRQLGSTELAGSTGAVAICAQTNGIVGSNIGHDTTQSATNQGVSLLNDTITANGVRFSYLHTGHVADRSRPLALCLHGFPDSAMTFRHLMPLLAEAGFRPVASYQRGYAPTEVPADGRYQTAALALDANSLHEAFGGDGRAVIIGHDWGAPATYGAANSEPDRWTRVVGMSVPPGGAMGRAMFDPQQVKRSWYMFFFQHFLSDMVVPGNDLAFIDMLWADWSPGFDATEDLGYVKAALREPANLQAALGYYRATLGSGFRDPALDPIQAAQGQPIQQPTLYLHGATDGCIGAEFAVGLEESMPHADSRAVVVPGAGHFLQLEQPTVVNGLILEFLGSAGR